MSKRHERLTELFLREITSGLRDVPNINERGLLTITGAELSGDDKTLTVFYSVINANEEQLKAKEHLLAAHARELRTLMYKRLRLRSIPEIHFEYDTTPEQAAHIEELLKKVRDEKKDDPKSDENTGSGI